MVRQRGKEAMPPSSWKKYKLKNLAATITRGISPTYSQQGIYVLNQKCIRNGKISYTHARFHYNTRKKVNDQKYLQQSDTLVCSTGVGTLGRVGRFTETIPNISTVDSHVTIVRPNQKIFPLFLSYAMIDKQPEIELLAEGTTGQTELSRIKLGELEISVPPIEEQKRIAGVLGAFDDKIELLQKQNTTLENMAKALFKSWFVDFDVVHAKQQGRPKAAVMQQYHLTEELYNLFPSSFEPSSLGPIPTGWQVKNAGDLLKFSIGGGWGNEEKTTEFSIKAPVIRGTDIPNLRHSGAYKDVPVRYHKVSNHTSRVLQVGDIILETAGGSKGQPVGRTLLIDTYITKVLPNAICASFCKLLRPNKTLISSALLYFYLDRMYQTGEIELYQVQSTGISNFQFKQFLEDKQFIVPQLILQEKLFINQYIDKIGNNKQQIQTLTEMRDALLPRLISGKIRV